MIVSFSMKKVIYIIAFVLPLFVSAQTTLFSLKDRILSWINQLIPIAFALALLLFFYGLGKFILNSGSSEAKAEGRNLMVWGVIAFFVMASLGGFVLFLQSTFNINNTDSITQPQIRFK